MTSECVFCGIAAGQVEADIVDANNLTVAFLDNRPLFPGHTLVIPRAHVVTIEDLDDTTLGALFMKVREITRAVRTALGAEGAFVAQNNVVSQSVPHVHVHVVPRTRGDGLRGFFWPRTGYRDAAHRRETAAAIRSQLAD